jgi:16S rRNA (cytidine1402-2'-O)-methyltransferase
MPENALRPALYVVATPIGNLGDITLRALEVLRAVDLIAAEDTRVAARLLAHFAFKKPLLAIHQHNERRACSRVLETLQSGRSVAFTTDAGTPSVSDPGAVLVEHVRSAGFDAIAIPGPSALVAAWSVSGFPGTGFLFHGFLPARASERRRVLATLANIPCPLIFYEAPHRVLDTMRALRDALGAERTVVVARELTKFFETVHVSTLGAIEPWLLEDPNRQRGEFVVIVTGAVNAGAPQAEAAEATLRVLLGELPPAQAARLASRLSGMPRAALYDMAVRLRGEQ